jgi:hypothetical protein
MLPTVVVIEQRRVRLVRLHDRWRVCLQERLLRRGGRPEQGQHLVATPRPIDEPAPRIDRGERAERGGARDVGVEQSAVVLDGGVGAARLVAVEHHQLLARG